MLGIWRKIGACLYRWFILNTIYLYRNYFLSNIYTQLLLILLLSRFSPADTNLVLREFEKCGVILKHVTGPRDANWMHILFQVLPFCNDLDSWDLVSSTSFLSFVAKLLALILFGPNFCFQVLLLLRRIIEGLDWIISTSFGNVLHVWVGFRCWMFSSYLRALYSEVGLMPLNFMFSYLHISMDTMDTECASMMAHCY